MCFGLLSGCQRHPARDAADNPTVVAASLVTTHSPAHPDTNGAVTIAARATGQVESVTLKIQEFALSSDQNGPVQTARGPERLVKTCDPPGPVPAVDCTERLTGFPAASLVRVTAEALSSTGEKTIDSYSFAAGAYPWPNDPIPIRATGAPASRLDVIFIPDTDITLASFRDQIDDLIRDRYFRYETYRGDVGSPSGAMYNFYYSQISGDIYRDSKNNCRFTNPANMAVIEPRGDVIAFMHRLQMQDCRVGKRFGSEIGTNGEKSLIHESGHALFGLSDEYSGPTSYPVQACMPNIYRSLSACEQDAPNLGLPKTACTRLSGKNLWRSDPAGATGCIMGDAQYNQSSNHGPADRRRINWRFGHCLNGQCYPTRECPSR